ncbi:MAG TPA: biotin--[acetyl-CoA-carboxylase] ligase [Synergistaceae bacterium]|nr:biotin--[acetyl-CoA-carboxylase] ligase [Synergistaceae bacterium]HPX03756.1 biotin--[acetyl-CoA-carboxylase] ligase [Synergistaceae bacterium]HQA54581.1 biotin--[acetyl-CoA-carboxylase] ligase [Synergistaceae bacterium]
MADAVSDPWGDHLLTGNNLTNSRYRLLEYLAENEGEFVPGSALTDRLGFSRQALSKVVSALKEEGLDIISVPQKGYMIKNIMETDRISPTLVDFLLRDDPIFRKCIYFPRITSTQHVIKDLARQDAPEGIVAVTDEQTEGRGRRGRSWYAPVSKNLLFSVLIRPELKPGDVQLLNLAAGLAVRSVLAGGYGIGAKLKWPNDILVNGRKICGILSEAAGEPDRIYYAVTGIGLNVNFTEEDLEEEYREIATSIMIERGVTAPRPLLLARILKTLSSLIIDLNRPEGIAKLLSVYRNECDTIGREVSVLQDDNDFRGTAVGITEQGALVVKSDNEEKIFAAADVHHLRMK